MRKRRIILAAVLLALLVGVVVVVWEVADWPPPRLILKYGLPPTGGPTGNVKTIEGIEFVELKPGYFRMGSTYLAKGGNWLGRVCSVFGLPWGERPDRSNEMPVHWVEIPHVFWMARTEITNEQYERFDGDHRPMWSGDRKPAVGVSWSDAREFSRWLSKRAGVHARLPSEAEWEYACRAGGSSEFCFGDDEQMLAEFAWFEANSDRDVHEVATRRCNEWGLFDMHGNVLEWSADTWHGGYRGAPDNGSEWVEDGIEFDGRPTPMFRGGNAMSPAEDNRSAVRGWIMPSKRGFIPTNRYSADPRFDLGFRPVFTLPEAE